MIHILYTGAHGNAQRFAREMLSSGTVEAIRAVPGNLQYDYFVPIQDPESVLLVDAWENQAALDAHHASPMMQKIAHLREKYDLHMQVQRFTEEESIPDKDKAFIRK